MSVGEIGVKIGAAANQLPLLALVANGIPQSQNGAAIVATAANSTSPAINVYTGPVVQNSTGAPNFVLNSSGADWGYLGNVSSGVWALGYTTGNWGTTLGTSALTWNTSGNITIAGTLAIGSTPTIGGSPTSYSSMTVAGETGGYAGFQFTSTTHNRTFMVGTGANTVPSGVYAESESAWDWFFETNSSEPPTALSLNSNATAFTIASMTLNVTSDRNQKTNIRLIDDALHIVESINGVRFDYLKGSKPSAGLIAQDVEAVIPELVETDDKNGKALNYNGVIGVLVEAVKELSARLKVLEAR